MENKDVEKTIEKTIEKMEILPYDVQRNEIKTYSIKMLESLATEVYKRDQKKKPYTILDNILYERRIKLDNIFEWTDDNKQKFLNVNNKFIHVSDKAYNEVISVANELENRINKNDTFIQDYEIEIKITPYMNDQFYDANEYPSIGFVLSEPISGFYPISHAFGHFHYKHNEKPLYLDRTLNWNNEYFGDIFKNDYICYEIHELLDTHIWSFTDILNINKIWIDIEVIHQHSIENI